MTTTEQTEQSRASDVTSDAVYDFAGLQLAKGAPREDLALALVAIGARVLVHASSIGYAARYLRSIADELEAGDLLQSAPKTPLQ